MKPSSSLRAVSSDLQPIEEASRSSPPPRGVDPVPQPSVPSDAEALAEARSVLAEFVEALGPWDARLQRTGPRLDVRGVSSAALEIVDRTLGEGAVRIEIGGAHPMLVRESVFAGIWRVRTLDRAEDSRVDWIEAAVLPDVVAHAAGEAAHGHAFPVTLPAGAVNSPSLLREIEAAMRACRPDARARVINLTLSPLTPDDQRVLEAALPAGAVTIRVHGFAQCRAASTRARNVWRVQYFNGADVLLLDTLEVVAVPDVALAAFEDLEESRERLEDFVASMGEDFSA